MVTLGEKVDQILDPEAMQNEVLVNLQQKALRLAKDFGTTGQSTWVYDDLKTRNGTPVKIKYTETNKNHNESRTRLDILVKSDDLSDGRSMGLLFVLQNGKWNLRNASLVLPGSKKSGTDSVDFSSGRESLHMATNGDIWSQLQKSNPEVADLLVLKSDELCDVGSKEIANNLTNQQKGNQRNTRWRANQLLSL